MTPWEGWKLASGIRASETRIVVLLLRPVYHQQLWDSLRLHSQISQLPNVKKKKSLTFSLKVKGLTTLCNELKNNAFGFLSVLVFILTYKQSIMRVPML